MDAPPVQYVKTRDGATIAYAIAGHGLPLIHLPIVWSHFSLQWSSGLRNDELEALAVRFRLVMYDGRGSGMSSRDTGDSMTIEQLDADLEAVVAQVASPKFLLHTRSPHGLVAIRYAARHPERVGGLVLSNYVDTSVAPFAGALRAMAEQSWETHLASQVMTSFPGRDPTLATRVLREAVTQREHIAIATALRTASAEPLLSDLQMPVLILASRSGETARPHEQAGRWLAERIPNAQLQLLSGPGSGWGAEDGEVSPAIRAIELFAESLVDSPEVPPLPDNLSAREVEVLRLIATGKSNQQIADELVISSNTVQRHVSNILDKTGTTNRTAAAGYARDRGLA